MEDKIKYWKTITEQWRSSGQSQKKFCEENGIKLSTLHYWMKHLKKTEADEVSVRDLVCISIPVTEEAEKAITIEIDKRFRISVQRGFCKETFREILAALG